MATISGSSTAAISPGIVNVANGHTYYLLETDTWAGSEAAAISLGGRLVTINDAAEDQWVFETFGRYGGQARLLWIGLTDAAENGVFRWISGQRIRADYRNWAPGEPNDAGSEGYVAIYYPGHSAGGQWNDWGERTHDPIGLPFNGVVEVESETPLMPADYASLNEGLAAAYYFNGDLRDASGNGNDATGFEAYFISNQFGEARSAAAFSPSGWAQAANSASLNINGDVGLTVAAWINLGQVVDFQTIVSKWGPGGEEDDQFYLGLTLGRLQFQTDDEVTTVFGQTRLQETMTYHVAGVYEPAIAQIAIYVNGRLDAAKPLHHPVRSAGEPLMIANARFGPQPLLGAIDDVVIYGRGLSAREVKALYVLQGSKPPGLEFVAPHSLRVMGTVGRAYDVEMSVDFVEWRRIGETIRPESAAQTVTVGVGEAAGFYRLRQVE